jgi:fructokinase
MRDMMKKVFCIGELLIDFVCKDIGTTLADGAIFEKKAGGAPANVAAAVTRLGGTAYFMGQVGNDPFGEFLSSTLENEKIDTSMLVKDGDTTLAFVSIDKNGERDFSFKRGADGMYQASSIDFSLLSKNSIIHFGSATAFLPGELKNTYIVLLEHAVQNGFTILFDPNYRDALITDVEAFKEECLPFIQASHIMKVSEEEAQLLTGENNINEAVNRLLEIGASVVCVTMGKEGTMLATKEDSRIIPSISIKQIDSTGAGDAFIRALLYKLSKEETPKDALQQFETLCEYIAFANKVGALTCTKYGAIAAIPFKHEIEE